jgi:hypothetical protein
MDSEKINKLKLMAAGLLVISSDYEKSSEDERELFQLACKLIKMLACVEADSMIRKMMDKTEPKAEAPCDAASEMEFDPWKVTDV